MISSTCVSWWAFIYPSVFFWFHQSLVLSWYLVPVFDWFTSCHVVCYIVNLYSINAYCTWSIHNVYHRNSTRLTQSYFVCPSGSLFDPFTMHGLDLTCIWFILSGSDQINLIRIWSVQLCSVWVWLCLHLIKVKSCMISWSEFHDIMQCWYHRFRTMISQFQKYISYMIFAHDIAYAIICLWYHLIHDIIVSKTWRDIWVYIWHCLWSCYHMSMIPLNTEIIVCIAMI